MGWTVYDALGRAKTVPNPTITPAFPDGLQNGVVAAGEVPLGAGSQLLSPGWAAATGGQTSTIQAAFGVEFSVREIVAQNSNNGTA